MSFFARGKRVIDSVELGYPFRTCDCARPRPDRTGTGGQIKLRNYPNIFLVRTYICDSHWAYIPILLQLGSIESAQAQGSSPDLSITYKDELASGSEIEICSLETSHTPSDTENALRVWYCVRTGWKDIRTPIWNAQKGNSRVEMPENVAAHSCSSGLGLGLFSSPGPSPGFQAKPGAEHYYLFSFHLLVHAEDARPQNNVDKNLGKGESRRARQTAEGSKQFRHVPANLGRYRHKRMMILG
ncbi:hypothetical protein C8F04DRAFT_1174237 [Mycena alexandri]|uniref:Uncharacterized protein n=1 Tax=Mycena alexandri TaxID=1745969 RepID=A0AAD6TEV7_9AGAR|nr:hypothetical protein C8F04DRAFT_1174237 [Mycena alexandri]